MIQFVVQRMLDTTTHMQGIRCAVVGIDDRSVPPCDAAWSPGWRKAECEVRFTAWNAVTQPFCARSL